MGDIRSDVSSLTRLRLVCKWCTRSSPQTHGKRQNLGSYFVAKIIVKISFSYQEVLSLPHVIAKTSGQAW